jgi:hypothetical protein
MDLANDILHCPQWDPLELTSPHVNVLLDPITLPNSIPYGQAKELDVEIPADDWGCIDDFIDDGITITLDIDNNQNRAVPAMLLAIPAICRPRDMNECILRDDCLSLGKLREEGTLSEESTILGWKINTHTLTMALPVKKAKYWLSDQEQIVSTKKVSYKKLEVIVGRLNHAAAACSNFTFNCRIPRRSNSCSNPTMDDFLLTFAVVAVHHFITVVYFIFFEIPTALENRVKKKRKREETTYKQNVSIKFDRPTTTLNAKQSLEEVLLDDNWAYMHKLIHLHSWQFFMLAERLQPFIKRSRDGKLKVGPHCKHDHFHRLFFCLKWLNDGNFFRTREEDIRCGMLSIHRDNCRVL